MRPMRIAINCRSFLKKSCTGIGRYASRLVQHLARVDGENKYFLYARKGLFSSRITPRVKAGNFTTCVDWFSRGPSEILKDIDLFHHPSPGPLEAPEGAKVIVTVHDVIFKAYPRGHTSDTILAGEKQFAEIKEKAAKVICCSQATAADLQTYFQIPTQRVVTIYPGVDKTVFGPVLPEDDAAVTNLLAARGVSGPYILSVGTIEPRKNLTNTVRAFHMLRARGQFKGTLVVIGMKGWLDEDLTALITKLGLKNHVLFLGYVPDGELRCFYGRAEAFLYPSFYEGFGFPILEAFCCGAPVVTSNTSSCAEIAGDAALTVDPSAPDIIASTLMRIVADPALRASLRAKGLKRAEDFNFLKTAEQTLRVYKEVYAS